MNLVLEGRMGVEEAVTCTLKTVPVIMLDYVSIILI